MPNSHFSVSILSRGNGGICAIKSAYTWKEKVKDEARGKTFNFSERADEVVYREMLLANDVPERFNDPSKLWTSIERSNMKIDAQLARFGSAALPRELNREQQIELARSFFDELRQDGMCCQLAIHDKDGSNPHVDFMLSMRRWDSKKGTWSTKQKSIVVRDENGKSIVTGRDKSGKLIYLKKSINNSWDDKKCVKKWRERWEKLTNEALQRAGRTERISLKSLSKRRQEALASGDLKAAKELTREPEEHYGPRGKKGKSVPASRRNKERKAENNKRLTRAEVISKNKKAAFFKKLQREKKKYTLSNLKLKYAAENPREAAQMATMIREGAELKIGEDVPKYWEDLEPRQHLQISESMKRCGLKSEAARKSAKKECVFLFDRRKKEWCFTRDPIVKAQTDALRKATKGAGKILCSVIGNLIKLPSKIPGINRIPLVNLPGQMASIAKFSNSPQVPASGVNPLSEKPKSGSKKAYDNAKTLKQGVDGLRSASPESTASAAPPKGGGGIKEVLKEALGEVNGSLDSNVAKKDGTEYSNVWMSESAKEQWRIDHGVGLDDEWEVQGFTKSRKINPNAGFRSWG